MMSSVSGETGPALLQLAKWDDRFPVPNFTEEFHEALLSPTKELVLLLSRRHSEALLVPLVAGDYTKAGSPLTTEDVEAAPLSVSSEISGSCTVSNTSVPLPRDSHCYISDINSVAWAVASGDTCSPQGESAFREILFVSGHHGVTVHIFCHTEAELCLKVECKEGTWVDGGPSTTLATEINKSEETLPGYVSEAGNGDLSKDSTEKKWLRSFFTKVETLQSGDSIFTRFPDKSSYPCSANVVSFSIFKSSYLPLDGVPHTDFLTSAYALVPLADTHSNPDMGSSGSRSSTDIVSWLLGDGMKSFYKCSRVFGNNKLNSVGFLLTLVDDCTLISSNVTGKKVSRNLLIVAVLDFWGMRWLCPIHLKESQGMDDVFEWADFQFTGDHIACLKTSGSIFLYKSSTGEYVTQIDTLQFCSPGSLDMKEGYSLRVLKGAQEAYSKRTFKKLIVASHPSLIAAVDKSGVVYVMHLYDYLPLSINSLDNKPYPPNSRFRLLPGWEVSGTDISHQNTSPELSDLQTSKLSVFKSITSFDFRNKSECDWALNGISSASRKNNENASNSKQVLQCMRKVFLPADKSSEHDYISLSAFGVTRLVNKPNLMGKSSLRIVHTSLHLDSTIVDDMGFFKSEPKCFEETPVGEAVGCVSQGCLYLVARDGLFVFLPNLSLSYNFLPVEQMSSRQSSVTVIAQNQSLNILQSEVSREPCLPWKIEVLDRVLLFECPEEADLLCLRNGWDLKISRTRRLQLALEYLKFDDLEQSLERLVLVDLAEEGVLRLIFAAVYLMFSKAGGAGDVSSALRLLAVASAFATKMIHKYGMVGHKKAFPPLQVYRDPRTHFLLSSVPKKEEETWDAPKKLTEMAYLLEIVRNLQCRLTDKYGRFSKGRVSGENSFSFMGSKSLEDGSLPPFLAADQIYVELSLPETTNDMENNIMLPSKPSEAYPSNDVAVVPHGEFVTRKKMPIENPKDMMARWELENLDMKTIIKDALLSGRLPLAVLQLQIQRSKDVLGDKEPYDTFTEVRKVGRAIAYDLFLKGEAGLAVGILQRLGEDIESSLKQLVFGTVRKSLRLQLVEEMRSHGYLGPYECKMLDRMSIIERSYPSSSFWKTFQVRQEQLSGASSSWPLSKGLNFEILHTHFSNNVVITCGDVDGVILGEWTSLDDGPSIVETATGDENANQGFWAAAVAWSDVWDQKTIERMVLDRSCPLDVHLLWESQFEYHICHNDSVKALKLLEMVPRYLLSDGSIHIGVAYSQRDSNLEMNRDFPSFSDYKCSVEEPDAMHINIPFINLIRFPYDISSLWLGTLIEEELAKKLVFLREYWEGTREIITLLARSSYIIDRHKMKVAAEGSGFSCGPSCSDTGDEFQADTLRGLDKLVTGHSIQYDLPNLLDLYLDYNKLILDEDSYRVLKEATEHCQWAKWLILTGIKGHEYDASFSNYCSVMSRESDFGKNISVPDIDEVIHTVDDMAEGGEEMAALATLMYATVPIQNCLNSGSVNRHYNSSAQCTLENLRPALQRFPTLWRTFVAACFGHDATYNLWVGKVKHVTGNSSLLEYLNWRDNIFFATEHDTSILQMLPCWFPKSVRRLVQLYVQGPLGWQTMGGLSGEESLMGQEIAFLIDMNENEISAIAWEAAIQKQVEQELHNSSLEEIGHGIEHHLHRGRPIAAFNHLLNLRVKRLTMESEAKGQSVSSLPGPVIRQSDVQTLLASLSLSEESLLSSVMPLAIMHFEDSTLVASCAFLLELCGLSVNLLHVDVAVLKRIASFYESNAYSDQSKHMPNEGPTFHGTSNDSNPSKSLAQALADDYLHYHGVNLKGSSKSSNSKRSLRSLIHILQHLEKVSLPHVAGGNTFGTWLSSGNGDGNELRSQQKAASLHWNLVIVFCQIHHIPPSTKYLSILARDNDWVGFLSEAQIGGCPFEAVVQVASKEFSDPRLRSHMLTVLKSMQSRKQVLSSSNSDVSDKGIATPFSDKTMCIPAELFEILADCEKQTSPGEALLKKAKDLCWSILALVASCFPDASPLSCLTVWLEITAARETSSIKVNDIASQIACNVRAAVEATNLLSMSSRTVAFHYNRKSSKRRRIMEPSSENIGATTSSSLTTISDGGVFTTEELLPEGELQKIIGDRNNESDEISTSLSNMVAVLCEQKLFLPLLRAFEIFLPSCSLLPFIRALQAFSQMRLTEAAAHLGSFSLRIKEVPSHLQAPFGKDEQVKTRWVSSTAVKSADAMLSTCPSPYEKKCLLELLADAEYGDGGLAASRYQRLYWKINIAEPLLRNDNSLHLGNKSLDDASLLQALEKSGQWELARTWAKLLEASGGPWKSAVHHVTETQAESMVAEWKEFLWDIAEERLALWAHCQTLFLRHAYPPLQAGLFFLKHAEAMGKDFLARELHEVLLLSLQWLSGMMTKSNPVYQLHHLREIETRVWLLAVESEAQLKNTGEITGGRSRQDMANGNVSNIIDKTATIIARMDSHINSLRARTEIYDGKEYDLTNNRNAQPLDPSFLIMGGGTKSKRRAKNYGSSRRLMEATDRNSDADYAPTTSGLTNDVQLHHENINIEVSLSRWEERVEPAELERAVLSLLEFGQIAAAKQLQNKLSPTTVPPEFQRMDAVLKLAAISPPNAKLPISMLDDQVRLIIQSNKIVANQDMIEPLQVMENLSGLFSEGSGRGLCKRIIAVVKAASVLGLSFTEAFDKQPIEVLQLLSLKAQESFEEAKLLVETHSMPAASIAQILAESFLKGLLAAHRGGYIDSQKEEGPAPLLWRFSDFLKWAELCPSEPEIGHALMRLVITGQEIPHACEVELLILSHHFYKLSACLDGVDVLVELAATRVEAYVMEGDFACLARLITGVGNFHALNFILGILIENGKLDLLLQKFSAAADTNTGTAEAVRGFRMAVLTSLKHFSPNDLDAYAMVYNHFDMKHETASLLESRAKKSINKWNLLKNKDHNEDLLDSMRNYIEAAEVHSSIDAGNKTRTACAQASLVSLQIRMPDFQWLNLSETNARRALVDQSRFPEALIVAEAYGVNQPGEWTLLLWNLMLKPELLEQFVNEFVAVLPLQSSTLLDLAKFYKSEMQARGDQSQFSVWLTGGGLPADWAKYLWRSFRCLLRRTRDLRTRLQLANAATWYGDVVDACVKILDKVPESAGPLILKRGHGGAYLPIM